ncbi:uncharacterized protein LOC130727929 [Lotus japonicus]|uniref:uncharacterized protein LOC130727929 n=1 Tax=Lotus japonicus TaxID=34305 RepID=UPI00259022FB|nr:uncharacterized protein LOC130727929 [Lotus japonicus]XP_057435218.1 uncharacterized protein LOC130727929 [Lotus japonicus]
MVMKERDEELSLFLEMRRREKENEKNNLLLQNSEELDLSNLESNRGSSMISKTMILVPPRKTGVEVFLNSENGKSEYEWLLTPPDSPRFPTLEKQSQISAKNDMETRNARPTALKPRVANIQAEPAARSNAVSKNHAAVTGLSSCTNGGRRPSSSRSSTPSGRPTLPSTTRSSRPSTPTSRATLPSAKSIAPPVRSSTPTRSTSRASTPTSRTSQRSATPTLRSSTPTRTFRVSAPPTRPSSASKARPIVAKNPAQSRGISPSVKSRPWEPSQMPGYSLEAPPNLKTSLPERPASATRSRPGAQNTRSSSVEASSSGKSRRQSSTPSKGRASTGFALLNYSSMQALSRARFTDGDHDSPGEVGTKMVERVVNMRKLAPPKREDHHSSHNNSNGKSSSSGSSGFGCTLSKTSLDMAKRHMDIRRSIQGNLRPVVTNIPASSTYNVRSASASKSRTISVSDSPLATSSTASSEPSVNNNSPSYDGSEIGENDFGSERGNSSPMSHHS